MIQEFTFGADPERLKRLALLGIDDSDRDRDATLTASLDLYAEGPGGQIGSYRLLSVLGEGGMGIVFLAEQREPIRRQVALKVIKPGMDSARVLARFEAERQALALLDHPNVAHVYDAGATSRGRPYFAMEYIKGVPVTDHCDHQKLTIEQRLKLFLQVCDAIQYAHQKGIIHRDIKPSNIQVRFQGDRAIPKIIDFGVAKALSQPLTDRTLVTEHGQVIGTPEYMSPEQADIANQDIDTRTDIYSLGVLLYKLLTGTLPFESKAIREGGVNRLRHIICEESPKTPSTRISSLNAEDSTRLAQCCRTDVKALRRSLRGDLDWITLKAMEKDRAHRYQTAHALAEDIQRHLDHEPVLAGPPSIMYRLRKLLAKHRIRIAAAAGIAVMLGLAAVISVMYAQSIGEQAEAESLGHKNVLSTAQQLRSSGQFQEALNAVQTILDSEHVGLEATLLRAGLLLDLQGPASAVTELETLLGERDEVACQAHLLLARIYLESASDPATMREYQRRAEEHQKEGERLLPETSEAYFNRAMLAGTVRKTLEYLDRAVELDRSHYDAVEARARAHYTLRDYRKLERDAVSMMTLRDWDPLGYSLMAIALREAADPAEALKYHNRAIQLSPNDPELYQQRYETYALLEDYQAALNDMQRCLGFDPNNVHYHFQVFCALTTLGRYEDARAKYEDIFQPDSDDKKRFEDLSKRYVFDTLNAKRQWHPAGSAPDGSAFAAMNEADEYYRIVGQKAVRVATEGFSCSWAPDGNELAYSRGIAGSNGIEIVNVETGVTRLLVVPGKDPAWSPDGKYIAYVRDRRVLPLSHLKQERTGIGMSESQQEVWLVRADGTEEPRFLAKGINPSWGNDPQQIFYLSQEDARIHSISINDTAKSRPLVWLPGKYPVVSPDGEKVACVLLDRLCIADPFGKRLLHDLLAPAHTWSAGWLPDGSALGLGGDEGLWIYDIDTQEASLLLPGPVTLPRWSRDGSRVAFTLGSPYDGIWVADSAALAPLQSLEQCYRDRIEDATRAIEANPEAREGYTRRARYHMRLGLVREAVADWRRYLDLEDRRDPTNQLDSRGGWAHALQWDWVTPETAVPVYETLFEGISPPGRFCLHFFGTAYCLAGQWEKAVTALNEASRLPGSDFSTNAIFLAIAYEQLGNRPEAIRHYRRAQEWMARTRLDVIGSRWNYLRKFYLRATRLLGVRAKGFRRDTPITGEHIPVTKVHASGTQTDTEAALIVNGTGLADQDNDGLLEHDETSDTMWLNSQQDTKSWLEFDFGEVYELGCMCLWNYNEKGQTRRGIRQADISIWTPTTGWQKVLDDFKFAEAEGSFDYDEPDRVQLEGVKAQKVRLDDLVSFGDSQRVGLSEVQFFRRRGPEAIRLYPTDRADIGTPPDPVLRWTPGAGVKAHRAYVGTKPDELEYMGRFEVGHPSQVPLPGLERAQTYWWRIDAEKPDGSIVEGELHRFMTGQMIGRWQFDQTDGKTAVDSSGNGLDGTLVGDARIVQDAVRGSVLSLDGDRDYVDCGSDPLLRLTNSMTVAAWIKISDPDRLRHDIVSNGEGCWKLGLDIWEDSLSFYCCGLHIPQADAYYTIVARLDRNDGQWHHVAGVYDGWSISIYVDGKCSKSTAATGTVTARTWPVRIGANPAVTDRDWSGLLDDVRIYSYGLTAEEIKALHAGKEPTLAEQR
ncbi:MAG: protein kinase [Phycisphaerales bacterium]|nr:MAG: protein kinase [Phycisphaerales bacterium]